MCTECDPRKERYITTETQILDCFSTINSAYIVSVLVFVVECVFYIYYNMKFLAISLSLAGLLTIVRILYSIRLSYVRKKITQYQQPIYQSTARCQPDSRKQEQPLLPNIQNNTLPEYSQDLRYLPVQPSDIESVERVTERVRFKNNNQVYIEAVQGRPINRNSHELEIDRKRREQQ